MAAVAAGEQLPWGGSAHLKKLRSSLGLLPTHSPGGGHPESESILKAESVLL